MCFTFYSKNADDLRHFPIGGVRCRWLDDATDVDELVGNWARQLEELVTVDEEERDVARRGAQREALGAEVGVENWLLHGKESIEGQLMVVSFIFIALTSKL